jgi:hypothetical protein
VSGFNNDQIQAIRCAHADLVGAKQAKEQNDIHVHDWKAHHQSILDLEYHFPKILEESKDEA